MFRPIQFSKGIQPIKLPTNCVDTDAGGLRVYAAGIGQTYEGESKYCSDGLLRQATFLTHPRSEYHRIFRCDKNETGSIILVGSPKGSDLGFGDSGAMRNN